MLPANLSICFAPNLLRPKVHSISAALDIMKVNGIGRFGPTGVDFFPSQPDEYV